MPCGLLTAASVQILIPVRSRNGYLWRYRLQYAVYERGSFKGSPFGCYIFQFNFIAFPARCKNRFAPSASTVPLFTLHPQAHAKSLQKIPIDCRIVILAILLLKLACMFNGTEITLRLTWFCKQI